MDSNVSLADIAAVTDRDGDMWGGNSAWVLIILFALIFMWGGNGFGNGRGEAVTESALCNSQNFNNLQNAVGRGFDQNVQLAMQSQRDMCTSTSTLSAQIASAAAAQERCCCETQRLIDRNNYDAAMNTASINANTTAQTQKILDAICGNRIADMQNQINALQLQAAMCGVVRYPLQTTYASPCNPFFGNAGCGCANI